MRVGFQISTISRSLLFWTTKSINETSFGETHSEDCAALFSFPSFYFRKSSAYFSILSSDVFTLLLAVLLCCWWDATERPSGSLHISLRPLMRPASPPPHSDRHRRPRHSGLNTKQEKEEPEALSFCEFCVWWQLYLAFSSFLSKLEGQEAKVSLHQPSLSSDRHILDRIDKQLLVE